MSVVLLLVASPFGVEAWWGMICFAVFVCVCVCVFLLITHYFPDLASSVDPGAKTPQQSYTELKLCNKYSALGVD